MSHNFRSRYARKSIKVSIEADFDLVFKYILNPKDGPLGHRQAKMAKLTQKHPYL